MFFRLNSSYRGRFRSPESNLKSLNESGSILKKSTLPTGNDVPLWSVTPRCAPAQQMSYFFSFSAKYLSDVSARRHSYTSSKMRRGLPHSIFFP